MSWTRFQTLLAEKRYQDAGVLCDNVLAREPGALAWRLGKVCVLLGLGQPDDAILIASPLVEEPTVSAQACRLIALAHLARKEPARALEWGHAALERAPNAENARFLSELQVSAAEAQARPLLAGRSVDLELRRQETRAPKAETAPPPTARRAEPTLEIRRPGRERTTPEPVPPGAGSAALLPDEDGRTVRAASPAGAAALQGPAAPSRPVSGGTARPGDGRTVRLASPAPSAAPSHGHPVRTASAAALPPPAAAPPSPGSAALDLGPPAVAALHPEDLDLFGPAGVPAGKTPEPTVVYDLLALDAARKEAQRTGEHPFLGLEQERTAPRGRTTAEPRKEEAALREARLPDLAPNVDLEARIHRMFGASLFGLWDSGTHAVRVPAPFAAPRRRGLRRQMVAAAVFAGIVAGASAGVEAVRRQRRVGELQAELETARHLLELGAMPQLASALTKLERALPRGERSPEQAQLFLRADVLLYRFHDADPARRQRVVAALAGSEDQDLRLAALLFEPRARAAADEALLQERIVARPTDSLYVFLSARGKDGRKRREEAATAYRGAVLRQPADLALAYAALDYELAQGRKTQALALLEEMKDVQPRSPWTELASARLDDDPARALAALSTAEWPVVPTAEGAAHLAAALVEQDPAAAQAAVQRARTLVSSERPFLADWAERMAGSPAAVLFGAPRP